MSFACAEIVKRLQQPATVRRLHREEFVGGQFRILTRVKALDDVGSAFVGQAFVPPFIVTHENLGLHARDAGVGRKTLQKRSKQILSALVCQQLSDALRRLDVSQFLAGPGKLMQANSKSTALPESRIE